MAIPRFSNVAIVVRAHVKRSGVCNVAFANIQVDCGSKMVRERQWMSPTMTNY